MSAIGVAIGFEILLTLLLILLCYPDLLPREAISVPYNTNR